MRPLWPGVGADGTLGGQADMLSDVASSVPVSELLSDEGASVATFARMKRHRALMSPRRRNRGAANQGKGLGHHGSSSAAGRRCGRRDWRPGAGGAWATLPTMSGFARTTRSSVAAHHRDAGAEEGGRQELADKNRGEW
jgi:hypothetical protein